MNYRLNERNGEVNYLMMIKDTVVQHHTTMEAAQWACEHNKPKAEALPGHPEYCIHTGEFFFEGTWSKPRKRKKDAVCSNDYCELE